MGKKREREREMKLNEGDKRDLEEKYGTWVRLAHNTRPRKDKKHVSKQGEITKIPLTFAFHKIFVLAPIFVLLVPHICIGIYYLNMIQIETKHEISSKFHVKLRLVKHEHFRHFVNSNKRYTKICDVPSQLRI